MKNQQNQSADFFLTVGHLKVVAQSCGDGISHSLISLATP